MRLRSPSPTRPEPPAWVLFTVAIPLGILLYALSGGWDRLSDAMFVLTGGIENFTLHRWVSRMAVHLVLPALAVFLLLRLTRLGGWLAPNRLALGALLVADALILGYWARGLGLAALGQNPYPGSNEALTLLLTTSVTLGLGVLAASTLWHRWLGQQARARLWSARLLREI